MTTSNSHPRQLSGFSNVDRAVDPNRYVASLDRLASELAEAKQKLTELGGFRSFRLWLDLGCGVGHDLDEGAVGVDPSVALLTEARHRRPTTKLVAARGEGLPFRASIFEGCRIERVLQHVIDPSLVLREVFRRVDRPAILVGLIPAHGHVIPVHKTLLKLKLALREQKQGSSARETGCLVRRRLVRTPDGGTPECQ